MNLHSGLSTLNDFAAKKVIKQFAAKHHLVYFGRVDSREDEHQLVRGLTASTTHIDNHYTVGTIQGHDVILVHRFNTLTFPGKPNRKYKWLILQIDLKHDHLPHVFIDSRHHDETFFANVFATHPQFQDVTQHIVPHSSAFAKTCKVFGLPHEVAEIHNIMPQQVTDTIALHFAQFDFEVSDDQLLVYSSNSVVTVAQLSEMARVGIWLADVLNVIR